MHRFARVGVLSEFPEGRGRAVLVDGHRIAILRQGSRMVAVADACPHMGASLADGRIEDGIVTCPWHGWRYDVATGKGLAPARPWACVRTFEVKLEGDDVLVRIPEREPAQQEPEDDPSFWDAERWFRKRT
ncbi:MAG TPA: Rieske 2Fe-2S domain-containing protein [Candidatus Polarisedimenticolaceae bacterium]|nr:Rieske 2Fe-2S domain-containing protein [Candidatus Polarisedimenticolaceae bacterium]